MRQGRGMATRWPWPGFHAALRREVRNAAPWPLFAMSGVALRVTAVAHSDLPGQPPMLHGVAHGTATGAARASFARRRTGFSSPRTAS